MVGPNVVFSKSRTQYVNVGGWALILIVHYVRVLVLPFSGELNVCFVRYYAHCGSVA
jgi:hypothetical protein